MTDQTVPVPLDLLKRIEDKVFYSADSPLVELRGYIPTPPKVGDALTQAQIEALPERSVIADRDGDIWIKGPAEVVSLVGVNHFPSDVTYGRIRNDGGSTEELAGYGPVLVYLPSA